MMHENFRRHTLLAAAVTVLLSLQSVFVLAAETPNPKPAPVKPPDTEKRVQPTSPDSKDTKDDAQQLLAERERKQGAFSPGKDPAFLIMPRPLDRSETAAQLMTPQVREMIEKALAYLMKAQEADGAWSDSMYPSNTGVTALCCLAFMSEGSQPRAGKYGKSIDRGLEFILKNVQSSGVISGKGSNPLGPMYEHSLSTLALVYASGDMPWRGQTRDVISKAVQALSRSQKVDGGWRYDVSREGKSDMSVTSNVLWVLRAAKKSGFTISADSINKGVKYIEQCAMPDGTFRYRYFGQHSEPSLGGLGVIALAGQGNLAHPLIPNARDRIVYDYKRYTIEDLKQRRYFVYGSFYASLAMYVCGDECWVAWYKKTVQTLATMQRKDGEFPDEFGNTIYSTAHALMVLQAPLGYLPIYER